MGKKVSPPLPNPPLSLQRLSVGGEAARRGFVPAVGAGEFFHPRLLRGTPWINSYSSGTAQLERLNWECIEEARQCRADEQAKCGCPHFPIYPLLLNQVLENGSMNTESKKVLVGEGVKFERIRRITGYLVGTVDRFNNAKRAEVEDRVKHCKIGCCGN